MESIVCPIGIPNGCAYGKEAVYETPADNPFVLEMLKRLGFDTIDSLLEKDHIFTRRFDA